MESLTFELISHQIGALLMLSLNQVALFTYKEASDQHWRATDLLWQLTKSMRL